MIRRITTQCRLRAVRNRRRDNNGGGRRASADRVPFVEYFRAGVEFPRRARERIVGDFGPVFMTQITPKVVFFACEIKARRVRNFARRNLERELRTSLVRFSYYRDDNCSRSIASNR